MSNANYPETFNNLVDMAYEFKVQPHYQSIVFIVTEGKYPVGIYDIFDLENK